VYERPTSPIANNPSSPSGFRGLGRFRTDLSQSVSSYEIWGRPWHSWMADLTLKLLPVLVVIFVVAEHLRRALLKVVRVFTITVAPPDVPAPNTTSPAAPGPVASAEAASASTAHDLSNPAANTTEGGSTASSASADQQATFDQHIQQWIQRSTHYWQTFKNAIIERTDRLNLWAMNLVWGGNPQPHVLVSRAMAIWFACVCIFMLAFNLLMGQPAPAPPGFAPTATTNSPHPPCSKRSHCHDSQLPMGDQTVHHLCIQDSPESGWLIRPLPYAHVPYRFHMRTHLANNYEL